jgi:hypothetical protein
MERRFRVRLQELLDDAVVRPSLLRGVLPRVESFLQPFVRPRLSVSCRPVHPAGATTSRVTFDWASFTGVKPETVTLDVTYGGGTLTVALNFNVEGTDKAAYSATRPATTSTWPTVIPPDAVKAGEERVGNGPYHEMSLASGDLHTHHAMPAFNPGVAPLGLTYSSTAASDASGPIFLEHYVVRPLEVEEAPGRAVRLAQAGGAVERQPVDHGQRGRRDRHVGACAARGPAAGPGAPRRAADRRRRPYRLRRAGSPGAREPGAHQPSDSPGEPGVRPAGAGPVPAGHAAGPGPRPPT